MKRVLIIDDHEVVRNGLKKILEEQPGEIEFGEAGTADEAIELVRERLSAPGNLLRSYRNARRESCLRFTDNWLRWSQHYRASE